MEEEDRIVGNQVVVEALKQQVKGKASLVIPIIIKIQP